MFLNFTLALVLLYLTKVENCEKDYKTAFEL
jgi:hypothetical protein